MNHVYDVYVWRCGRLLRKAEDIVAGNKRQAAYRGVEALLRRHYDQFKRDERELRQWLDSMRRHLVGYGKYPAGDYALKVVHKADGPRQWPCEEYE